MPTITNVPSKTLMLMKKAGSATDLIFPGDFRIFGYKHPMRSQYQHPQKQPAPEAPSGVNTSSKGKQLPAVIPIQKQAEKGISEQEFSAEEKPQPGKFILSTAVTNTPSPLQAKFVIPGAASQQQQKTRQPDAWHVVQKRAATVTQLVTNQSAVIQYKKIKIIDSNSSFSWTGNEKKISVNSLLSIVKKARNFRDGHINLGEEEDYWITIVNVINGVETAIAEAEGEMEEEGDGVQDNTELNKLRRILAALNDEGPLDAPDVALPPKTITPGIKKPAIKPAPVKKIPVKPVTNKNPVVKSTPKRKLDEGPGDLSSETSSHGDEEIFSSSGKKQEKPIDKGKKKVHRQQKKQKTAPKKPLKLTQLPRFGSEQDNDTSYAHDSVNRRLFLTDAPPKVLGLMGESGKLIKGKDFNGAGPAGEKADLRYIDFVNVIDDILTRLEKNPVDKALLQRTIKILHEFLVFILDFKYRVRYLGKNVGKDVQSSRLKEIEKCRIEVEVLNGMVENIVAAPSPLAIPALIQRARDFFNITFGFGVTGSIHPGDMFGGPIDVNHVNFQSSFTERHYKRSFKRTEDIRKETNKGHEGSTFEEDYFTKGLFTIAEHAVTEFGGDPHDEEEVRDFIKSKGISRESVKRLRKKPDEEEEEERSFSDYLADSESDGEEARRKFVPNESDTISEFAQKLEPYLITSADYAKQFNETILLRQHQLSKRPKQRDTHLLTIAKQQRTKEKADLEFIASGHKKEIADKLSRQLEEINAMLRASEIVKQKKTATKTTGTGQKQKIAKLKNASDILTAWGRNDFVKQSTALQALKKKPDIDGLIAALQELKTAFESVNFDTFYEEHTKSGQEYVYNTTQKFDFLGDPKKRSVKKKADRPKKKPVSKAPSGSGSSKKEPDKPPQTSQQLKESALVNDFIAELKKVPQQEDEDDEGASKADHTYHASKFIDTGRRELSKKARPKSTWFNLIPNKGGGDCLLYALKGKNFSFEEGLLLRAQIAEAAGVTLPPNISGNSVYQTLHQSGLLTRQVQVLLQGKHQVPREVYQKLIKIPGVYTGEEEIQAYCSLEDSPGVIHVVTHEGEIREITADSITTIEELSKTDPRSFLDLIAGYLQKKELVLFKSANHWEKIGGLE